MRHEAQLDYYTTLIKGHEDWEFAGMYSDEGIRRRELERFILAVEKLPAMVTEFDEALWGSLVDHLTVNDKDDIVFTMSSGMEIKV